MKDQRIYWTFTYWFRKNCSQAIFSFHRRDNTITWYFYEKINFHPTKQEKVNYLFHHDHFSILYIDKVLILFLIVLNNTYRRNEDRYLDENNQHGCCRLIDTFHNHLQYRFDLNTHIHHLNKYHDYGRMNHRDSFVRV
jgi:hypothetical protein